MSPDRLDIDLKECFGIDRPPASHTLTDEGGPGCKKIDFLMKSILIRLKLPGFLRKVPLGRDQILCSWESDMPKMA